MRIPLPLMASAVALIAPQAFVRTVRPCGGLIDNTMISEPWDVYSRPCAEGAIRLFETCVAPTMPAGEVSAR